jgi:Cys-rich repeat protein
MKTHESRRLWTVLLAAGGLLLSLALLGHTGGNCSPIEPPAQTECRTDADCAGLTAPLDCDGAYACQAGACELECTPILPPAACTRDADCGAGQLCDLGDVRGCCPGDDWCLMYLPVCEGTCVPAPPAGCWSDADCARGEWCLLPPCRPGAVCAGTCVPHQPPPPQCTTDAECGPGMRCDLIECDDVDCGPGMDCYRACRGVCVPNGPPPVECWSDWDCGPGQRCEIDWTRCPVPDCPPGADCAQAMIACGGVCVPNQPPPVCYSDADCGPGYRCQLDDWCGGGSEPFCDEAGNCGAPADRMWCGGVCVPYQPPPMGCTSDAECAAGEYCLIQCWYGADCDAAGECGEARECYGVCVPHEPPPMDCFSDADCAPGYRCDYDPWMNCGGRVPADRPDGADGAPEYWNCVGRCVPIEPPPVDCFSDADCRPGEACRFLTPCARPDCPAGYECDQDLWYCPGVCVPIEPPPPAPCWSDADCAAGQVCQLDPACAVPDCPPGHDCGARLWACGGVCVPAGPPPVECWSNADCPQGMACEFLYDCAQPWCPNGNCDEAFWGCPGRCVWVQPPTTTECWSDIDCREGMHCEFRDGCGAVPACDPADASCRPPNTWCAGVCVPDEPPPAGCTADWECAADERCQIDWTVCDRCTDERCGPCLGTCVAIKQCLSDADCPGGTVCDYSAAGCFDWDCAEGHDCVPLPCVGECREPTWDGQA